MKISKKKLVDGVLMSERMGARMSIPVAEADPYDQGQRNEEEKAQSGQTGANDGSGAISTADVTQANANLRKTNKHEWQLNFNLLGDLSWTAGLVVFADKTWGGFSRNYILEKVVHRIARNGSGYSVNIEAHGCLEGY